MTHMPPAAKKSLILLSSATLLLAAMFAMSAPATDEAEAAWTAWHCPWHVQNYPVTGGTLHGRGCDSLWDGAALDWRVWADTYAPAGSYSIYTYVAGLDTCGGINGSYSLRMQTDHYDYSTGYGTSGVAEGSYADCGEWGEHHYRVVTSHGVKATSGSSQQGTAGSHTD